MLIFSVLYFLLFCIAVLLAFFIPGDLALRRLSLTLFQRFVLGIMLGMVLWGWQGTIFGYLGLRWLSYVYILITFIFWLQFYRKDKGFDILKKLRVSKPDLLTFSIIAIGSLMQITVVWFTGVTQANGLYLCCGNTSDSLFHIALTDQIVKNFPPFQPGMFGVTVQNYHYWSNLVIAELIRVFGLPLIETQYQYSTLFVSIFLGFSALVFGQIVKLGRVFNRWLIFFLYFGGDLIFLLFFGLGKGFNFNMSSLEDGARFLVNPPRAFSILVFFAGLSLLAVWIKKRDLRTGLLMAILLGSVIGFKVYSGIFALAGLGILGAYFLLKRNFRMVLPLIVTLIISFVVYLPVNNNAGGLYFTKFWLFENFIVQPALGLERLELARLIFEEHDNWLRVIQFELIFFSLFVFSVFGSKLIGLLQSKKSLSALPLEINIFLISGISVSLVLGFFFQQESGGANTFNFLVSVFIIGSIYTATACVYWLGKISKKIRLIIVALIIVLTVPRVLHEWRISIIHLLRNEGFVVSNSHLQSTNYLKDKTPKASIVLVDNRRFEMDKSSPYISFLSNRSMFFSGKEILESHGVDTSEKEKIVNNVLTNSNIILVSEILENNKINYIFMSTQDILPIEKSSKFVKTVFLNKDVKILKVLSY